MRACFCACVSTGADVRAFNTCSRWKPKIDTDDITYTHENGSKVVIDSISLPFLEGAKLNYVDDFGGSMLKVENPNATSSCGCGTSFTGVG